MEDDLTPPVEREDGTAVTEDRADPTYEDYDVAFGLKQAKKQIAGVKADQLSDPDHGTDPDDAEVLSAIEEAEAALDKAIVAQSKDGHEDQPARSGNWATPKRAFSSLVEQPPAHTAEFQVRMDAGEDNIARFVGYASTTGVPYSVRDWLGEYTETILPGAFAKTLREQGNVPLLFNHDGIPLASTGSGTSRLSEDKVGLRNEADLDRRDSLTNSICVQLQRGVLNKMSFSFRAVKETWNDSYDDRGVNEAALYDSSIVTYPANATTTAELQDSMRSALGREGRSLWLAEHELSIRSALPLFMRGLATGMLELESHEEDLLEKALRALVHADEQLVRAHGPHGRARTFHVARSMLELRAGKVLSAANQKLLQDALTALGAADKAHQKAASAHETARSAITSALDNADGNQGGNGIEPDDGAGARSAALRLRREREAEIRRLRSR